MITIEQSRAYKRKYYHKHYLERREQLSIYYQKYYQQKKIEVLTHYGNGKLACVKCGFDDIRSLSIDHMNGGGAQHRRNLGGTGKHFYAWLQRQGYPEGYQALCFNCQGIKAIECKENIGGKCK